MCKDKKPLVLGIVPPPKKNANMKKAMEKCICNASIVRNVTAIVTQATIDIKAAWQIEKH